MPIPKRSNDDLLEKILSLPPEKLAEVEDFVDFLRERSGDSGLARAATRLSEDADYDRL